MLLFTRISSIRLAQTSRLAEGLAVALLLVGCTTDASLGANDAAKGGDAGLGSMAGSGVAGAEMNIGGGGASGDSGSVGGDAGTFAQGGGTVELTCAPPTVNGCPGNLVRYSGQKADLSNDCWKAEEAVSCSSGASDASTCWVDSTTGDVYRLAETPCKPEAKWRDCSQAESDAAANILRDCP